MFEKDNLILTITEETKLFLKKKIEQDPGNCLRIQVESGGCAGFQILFSWEPKETPEASRCHRVSETPPIVMESSAIPLLQGAILDFSETLLESRFLIRQNPQAARSCGCKTSFALAT
jgi:iron-sulfur cluster assembly protein/iron-sulfur cluster insertion protein